MIKHFSHSRSPSPEQARVAPSPFRWRPAHQPTYPTMASTGQRKWDTIKLLVWKNWVLQVPARHFLDARPHQGRGDFFSGDLLSGQPCSRATHAYDDELCVVGHSHHGAFHSGRGRTPKGETWGESTAAVTHRRLDIRNFIWERPTVTLPPCALGCGGPSQSRKERLRGRWARALGGRHSARLTRRVSSVTR